MTTNPSAHQTIAVIGGTGRTGHRVADRLRARGLDVRIGSHSGSPPFHWDRPPTWAPALHGSAAAYVACTPDFTRPGVPRTLGAFAEEADRAAVAGAWNRDGALAS